MGTKAGEELTEDTCDGGPSADFDPTRIHRLDLKLEPGNDPFKVCGGVPIIVEVVAPLGGYLSSREAPELSTSGSGASAVSSARLLMPICRVTSALGTVRAYAADSTHKLSAVGGGQLQAGSRSPRDYVIVSGASAFSTVRRANATPLPCAS
jgi:hypothetical protein